ncbi:hypothetical protein [Roseospira goensis]|uniref:Beta-lactamase superfamily II metal-dependent hydrolase n=1 Tax=Roseospira goensis TaxID=391922 RepID=A0A7W6WJJ8_9PROT|nr:hypothetical protein [Roseospira goensis]MBB4284582.1 beta-lactamase superfamily II metal-dependent hydrolase [Roseospira goensis]
MSYQRLYSLDVGQGMCTYFEEYDEENDVVANALFDLGSSKSKRRAGGPTVEFLAKRIKARSGDDKGYLDAMFISHKDSDHVNLIWSLLEALPEMEIGYVYHSGRSEWYTSSKGNVLTKLGERTENADEDVRNFRVGCSSFPSPNIKDWVSVFDSDHASAYVIAVNTSESATSQGKLVEEVYAKSKPDGDLANSTSLGIYMKMFNVGAVIFGDATFSTFQFVNQHFLEHKVWLQDTFMLLAPHHGSRLTTFGLSSTNGAISEEARKVVNTFASLTYGATIVVSADTKHSHPSLETINAFLTFADHRGPWWSDESLSPYHLVSAYFDVPVSDTIDTPYKNYTFLSNENYYTNLYYALNTIKGNFIFPPYSEVTMPSDVSFTEGMNWGYQIDAQSSVNTRNIPMAGIPSNRLPKTTAQLHALFQRETIAPSRGAPAPGGLAGPVPAGAARPPARPARAIRRLEPRR